jgi:hypothetical protein
MPRVFLINHRRPPAKPGTTESLYGFTFVVQDNGDRVCDMPEYAIADMEKADRVRRVGPVAHDFMPPVVEVKREEPGLLGAEPDKPLDEMTVLELKEAARIRRVSIPAGTNKDGIIELLLRNAENAG